MSLYSKGNSKSYTETLHQISPPSFTETPQKYEAINLKNEHSFLLLSLHYMLIGKHT